MSTQEQPTQGHTPVPFKELLDEATPGRWRVCRHAAMAVESDNGVVAATGGRSDNTRDPDDMAIELTSNAAYIARCNPATMAVVWEALAEATERIGQHRMTHYYDGNMEADAVDYAVQDKLFAAIALLNGTGGEERK